MYGLNIALKLLSASILYLCYGHVCNIAILSLCLDRLLIVLLATGIIIRSLTLGCDAQHVASGNTLLHSKITESGTVNC